MSTGTRLRKKAEEERKAFRPYEGRKKKDRHIRLTEDMMSCETYKRLTNNAKIVYQYMKLWAYASKEYKDKGTFDYSISLAMKGANVSKNTAISSLKQLESEGFIERQNNSAASKETTKWAFSDKWARQ